MVRKTVLSMALSEKLIVKKKNLSIHLVHSSKYNLRHEHLLFQNVS